MYVHKNTPTHIDMSLFSICDDHPQIPAKFHPQAKAPLRSGNQLQEDVVTDAVEFLPLGSSAFPENSDVSHTWILHWILVCGYSNAINHPNIFDGEHTTLFEMVMAGALFMALLYQH